MSCRCQWLGYLAVLDERSAAIEAFERDNDGIEDRRAIEPGLNSA